MSTSWDPNSPLLVPAIVCYADILGFRDMTKHAFKLGKEKEFLRRIKRSLALAYDQVREVATLGGAVPPIFDLKVFTDNIVVASPLRDPSNDLGEPELGTLLTLFAHVQASLGADGFFLRGAITVGQHYQDQDIAYGDALLEAVDLNKSGEPPRLVIGSSLEPVIAEHLSWYRGGWAPHHNQLLEDPCDGQLFVNYLRVAFEYFPDGPIDYQLLAAHRKRVRRGLMAHESDPRVRQKYEWVTTYHNYVCRSFADRFPVRGDEGANPEEMAIGAEARRALDHLIARKARPDEQFPRPLDARRLQQRAGRLSKVRTRRKRKRRG